MKVAASPTERWLHAVPPPDDAGCTPGPDPTAHRAIARVIEEAIDAGRVVHIDYVDRHGEQSRRTIEPVGFVQHREQWFLLAWCRVRGAARTFRLDRVVRAVATGEIAECPALSLDGPEASLVRATLPGTG